MVPVDQHNLHKAQDLLKEIFPDESAHFEISFSALKKAYHEHETMQFILQSEFWLVVNTTNGVNREAAGICGLSYFLEDYSDTIWGDWYGGSPLYSGRGLGASIALFCLEKAMALEKKYICIMTEDMPLKKNANKFYDLVGIKVVKKEDLQHNGIHTATRLWRQKKIGGRWSTRFFPPFPY